MRNLFIKYKDDFLIRIFAVFIFCLVLMRSITKADMSWDSLAYHLPFSAMRVGILTPQNYDLPDHLWVVYESFPSLIYYIKGFLWIIFNKPEFVQVVSPISLLLFVLFSKQELRVPWYWALIGILSIPIVQIGASANMTDVPSNIGLGIISILFLKTVVEPNKITIKSMNWLMVGCVLAGGTKLQSMAVGSILLFLYILILNFIIHKKINFITRKTLILYSIICLGLVSHPAVKNVLNYRNPIYPMNLKFGPIFLQGQFNLSNGEFNEPQQFRWLKSVLEINAFNYRHLPYTIDQGDVPVSSKSFRVGGYYFPLIIVSIYMLIYNSFDKKKVVSLYIIFLTIIISSVPNSNELRYFSFWAIFMVATSLWSFEVLKEKGHQNLEVEKFFKLFVLVCFFHVVFITGGEYLKSDGLTYEKMANNYSGERCVIQIEDNNLYCYENNDFRRAIFDSIIFNKKNNPIVVISLGDSCGKYRK